MKKIDLVFRTVGERTSNAVLELAKKNIQPHQIYVIENVKPFSKAVQQMLKINYDGDFVVFIDADCLIMEDMVPFLQDNSLPYVDCFGLDKFRGSTPCGLHITRIDVVRAMQKLEVSNDKLSYVIRPESSIRDEALDQLDLSVDEPFKHFNIFHDFFQFYRHIFVKYALRELRSRDDYFEAQLKLKQADWTRQIDDDDFKVANYAVNYSREMIKKDTPPQEIAKFIEELPKIATDELKRLNIPEKEPLTLQQALELLANINLNQCH